MGTLGKFGKFIRKIRKEIGSLGKFVWKIGKKMRSLGKFTPHIRKVGGETEKKEEKKGPHLILVGKLGKLSQIRKIHWVN